MIITLNLDSERRNSGLEEVEFKQGNKNRGFKIKLYDAGIPRAIDNTEKPTIIFDYYDNMGKFVEEVVVKDVTTTDYNITVSDNTITIPESREEITAWFGIVKMGVLLDALYTYEIQYDVLQTVNYVYKSPVHNLPSMGNKADVDLGNVPGVMSAADGSVFYKKDGTLKSAPMRVDSVNKKIISDYSLQVPPNSVYFGLNTSMHENGGFLEYHTESLGKDYILMDYENDPLTGTKKPIYWQRGAKEIKFEMQPDATSRMSNVTVFNDYTPSFDRQIQAVYFNFANSVTNFKMLVEVNGHNVADYPTGGWNDATIPGYNLGTGIQTIALKPFWTELIVYSVKVYFKADLQINMMGNGATPYVAFDLNRITKKDVALMEDVGTGGGGTMTGDAIVAAIEAQPTTPTDKRLDASAIKNIPTMKTTDEIITDMEARTGDTRLDAKAIKNLPDASTVAVQVAANTAELSRLKTVIASQPTDVFTYRGNTIPTFTSTLYKAYYVSLYGLRTSGQTLNMPNPTPALANGSVICIDNNDFNDNLIIKPIPGETIGGRTSYTLLNENMVFLVKSNSDWAIAFEGYIPVNLTRMIGDIKSALPNQLNTIDEIQAALKDRLHTYREIQSEFSDQLHTFDAIDANMVTRGFSKSGSVSYGLADQPSIPNNNAWIIGNMNPNEEVLIPVQGGSKYVLLAIPTFLDPSIQGVKINGAEGKMATYDFVQNELKYKLLISSSTVDATQTIRLEIIYSSDFSGMTFDDGMTQAAGVKNVVLQNGKIGTYQDDPSKIDITTSLLFKSETGQDLKSTSIKPLLPLRAQPNPSVIGETVLDLIPGTFEGIQDDSYLAYLGFDTELMPSKRVNGQYNHDTIWFDDVQKDAGDIIGVNINEKSFVIEESDMVDPNLSNGEKYLMSCYLSFKGVAKSDCFIDLFLKKAGTTEYVTDANGNPCFISKQFKAGDAFGFLATNNLIIAKGQQEIQVCIIHNHSENITIEGLGTNISGVLIQQMKKGTVSAAKMQYEGDTDSSIRISKLVMNTLRDLTIKLRTDLAEQTFPEKYYQNDSDGFYMIAHSSLKSRRENGQLIIENDGNNKTFFEIGWSINEEEARALRGKSIHTDHIITVPLNDLTLGMYEWRGTGNPSAPVLQWNKTTNVYTTSPGWNEVLTSDITHSVNKQEDTTTFDIPVNANRFMLIMFPTTPSQPFEMRLQRFSVVVDVPFIDYVVRGAESTKQQYYEYDKSYARFQMLFNPVQGLRYTINMSDTKMPVGTKTIGLAPIELSKAWTDSGFSGEGALMFGEDGKATITTKLKMTVGENVPQGATENIEFWYAKANPDKSFFKIPESSTIFNLAKDGTYPKLFTMRTFTYDAKKDDVLWLFAKSTTVDDGAYLVILIGERGPMVDTDIYFTSLTAFQNDPAVNEMKFVDNNGNELFNRQLTYNVDTGKMTVTEVV